jgi:hypothetical protein
MGVVLMSKRELNRIDVLVRPDGGRLTTSAAADLMHLTTRQTHRLLKCYRDGGAPAIANRRRGRPSNNRLPEVMRDHAVALVRSSSRVLPHGSAFFPIAALVVNFIQTRPGVARSIESATCYEIISDKMLPCETLHTSIDCLHSRTTCHDRITRNFPAAGFDYCGRRRRGIDHRRDSGHRHIDARAGCQSIAKDREVSGHSEGGATLRQLRAV